jgi:hypothetical protein
VSAEKSKLYYGDNYEVLKLYLKDESVDLIYLAVSIYDAEA